MAAASEAIGFIASALVLATFATKEMRLLRTTAIFSNIAFIVYGAVNGLLPVVTLHLLLLPLNLRRLMEAHRPTPDRVVPSPRVTSKATRMAIEALYLADAARAAENNTSEPAPIMTPSLHAPDEPRTRPRGYQHS